MVTEAATVERLKRAFPKQNVMPASSTRRGILCVVERYGVRSVILTLYGR